eukprot:gb/GECG01009859.1/.p1 GENE.gb/GECG01009859.1/~~gb/GECG01009859.1/.p1  ORF type:complete len:150 (+),score=4.29 gb/GECG01009859.1/:1-450(+)
MLLPVLVEVTLACLEAHVISSAFGDSCIDRAPINEMKQRSHNTAVATHETKISADCSRALEAPTCSVTTPGCTRHKRKDLSGRCCFQFSSRSRLHDRTVSREAHVISSAYVYSHIDGAPTNEVKQRSYNTAVETHETKISADCSRLHYR